MLAQHQGICANPRMASTNPPQFARAASKKRPRTKLATLVVMPQLGQGIPNSSLNVHGGKPSASWVPYPRGSGSKQAATTKPHSNNRLHAPRVTRAFPPSGYPLRSWMLVIGMGGGERGV